MPGKLFNSTAKNNALKSRTSGAEDTPVLQVPLGRKIPILCIIGPTASGKSSRAVREALARGGEVISVDSRQVYRTLDIGTEKITAEEMEGVPHHLIDIRDPKDTYSAGDFVQDATRLISEIHQRAQVPILAGGTHFYFDALLNGLPNDTPINPELREQLEQMSTEELFARIRELDPRRAQTIDPKNRRRLIRALEIIETHGRVPERSIQRAPYDVEWIVLDVERDVLKERIATRLKDTLTKGLVEEARKVREYVGDTRLNELGLEYKIVGEYLRGELAEENLLPTLFSKLKQYARRQRAWIRKLTN